MKEKILSVVLCFFFATHIHAQNSTLGSPDTGSVIAHKDTYASVEQMPEFPGGTEALMKFISSNIKYPENARENNIEGKVIVRFIVNKEGIVEDVKVMNTIDSLLAQEAIRVIKLLPQWKPGMQLGKPVNVIFNLPVNFKLEEHGNKKKKRKD